MSTLVSYSNASTHIPALADTLYRLTGLSYFSAESRARRARYNQVFELGLMTDRELNDIGIARCDIHRIAREAAGLA